MFRIRHVSLALLMVAAACSADRGAAIATGPDDTDPGSSNIAEITGVVTVDNSSAELPVVNVIRPDGTLVRIVGSQTRELANLAGGEVWIRGTWDASPGLVLERFLVLAMNGRPALDGVLEGSDDGFGLRLADGGYRELSGAPAELSAFVGARIWFTGSEEDPPVAFGVIEAR